MCTVLERGPVSPDRSWPTTDYYTKGPPTLRPETGQSLSMSDYPPPTRTVSGQKLPPRVETRGKLQGRRPWSSKSPLSRPLPPLLSRPLRSKPLSPPVGVPPFVYTRTPGPSVPRPSPSPSPTTLLDSLSFTTPVCPFRSSPFPTHTVTPRPLCTLCPTRVVEEWVVGVEV